MRLTNACNIDMHIKITLYVYDANKKIRAACLLYIYMHIVLFSLNEKLSILSICKSHCIFYILSLVSNKTALKKLDWRACSIPYEFFRFPYIKKNNIKLIAWIFMSSFYLLVDSIRLSGEEHNVKRRVYI